MKQLCHCQIHPKKLSWVNFGLNASDVSLIEQYNASIKDLCNIYNVPAVLLNNTSATDDYTISITLETLIVL